jgi:co-chaperonin GroES (HSP10)
MFKPVNRYVWVKLPATPENTTESGIVLPDDYKTKEERYTTAVVVEAATDVRFPIASGSKVVIDKSMVEEINVNNELFTLVLDNYILGTL